MIFWIILFLLIIGVSFILAFQSMKDFAEKPADSKSQYGLFLIRNLKALSADFLNSLHKELADKGLIFSIEKLFKGQRAALVIYGPRDFLQKYHDLLDLLELEEYTNVDPKEVLSWEVNTTDGSLNGIPQLLEDEQFWWQVVLKPTKGSILEKIGKKQNLDYFQMAKSKTLDQPETQPVSVDSYKCQIRAVVWVKDDKRRVDLAEKLQNLDSGKLRKVPIPFTNSQILKMYKDRSLIAAVPTANLPSEKVLDLIKMPV